MNPQTLPANAGIASPAEETRPHSAEVSRPQINVDNTTPARLIPRVLKHVIDAQQDTPRLFSQYGGLPVRLRDGGRGAVEPLDRHSLRLELDRHIEFVKPQGRTLVCVEPPSGVVNGILAADRYEDFPQLPELRRVAEAPYFTRDGVLVTTNGYHAESRTFLRLPDELKFMAPVPDKPTAGDVKAARNLLTSDLFVNFEPRRLFQRLGYVSMASSAEAVWRL